MSMTDAQLSAFSAVAGFTPQLSSVLWRSSVLGRPRWNHPHLPSSWSPREEAEKAFGQ